MNYFNICENGERLYEERNFEGALQYFLKAYALNPSNTISNYVACCYIGLKNYKKAEDILVALTNTTHWETPWYNLGRVYMLQKAYNRAFKCLEEALRINPDNDDCYFYLGIFYEKKAAYELAIENYMKAVRLSEDAGDVSMYLNNIGMCFFNMMDLKKAAYFFDVALEKDANNEDAKHNKELVLRRKAEMK